MATQHEDRSHEREITTVDPLPCPRTLAASDPIMWRDIFLNNREAVLEMLSRFTEDLTALQRAIRWGEGEKLEDLFTRTRAVRRSIIEAKQA